MRGGKTGKKKRKKKRIMKDVTYKGIRSEIRDE
jgi:hypothetical protein